jgi:outer membrane protein, heavy metal efflux system
MVLPDFRINTSNINGAQPMPRLVASTQKASYRIVVSALVGMTALLYLCAQPAAADFSEDELEDGGIHLPELLEEVLDSNYLLISADAQAQRYHLRIKLVENLTEPLLAFYYLDYPVGNMSGGYTERINQAKAGPAQKVSGKGSRGKILTGRDMVEDMASWYQYKSDDLRLQVIQQVREKFYRIHFLNQIISITEQSLSTLKNLIRVSDALYAVGKIRQKDVLSVQSERYQLIATLLELRQQRLKLSNDLNYLAARNSSDLLMPLLDTALTHENLVMPKHSDSILISGLFQNRPLLKGYQSLAGRFRAMRGMAQMYFNREVRTEAMYEADSGLRALKAEISDFHNQLIAKIQTTTAALEKNRQLANLYGRVLVPQARHRYQANLADLKVGNADFRETLQAILDLNRLQVAYYQSLADYQVDLASLESLSGMEFN